MKCTFCNKEMEKGTGKVYIRTEGKQFYFCSTKCQKNMLKLKRDPRKLKWTKKK